jgi:hypothetical protein
MNNLMSHIDRCAELRDRAFNNLDGAVNPSTKSAWLRE